MSVSHNGKFVPAVGLRSTVIDQFAQVSTKVDNIRNEFYRKIHYLTREFHVKFHAKNRYRTNREAMSAISIFQVKFNVEFTSQVIDFP